MSVRNRLVPGSVPLSEHDEIQRLGPILSLLGKHIDVPISVDTQKASVARFVLDLGAVMINDVSALRHDEKMGACDRPSAGWPGL